MEHTHDEQNAEREVQPAAEEKTTVKITIAKPKKIFKDLRDILVVLTVFMLVYVLFFRVVVVVGDSMNNTLYSGDRLLLINNLLYREPERGDVIVASKDAFRDGECIIKRVIAVEGDVVDIGRDGRVYVNGEMLEEPYTTALTFEKDDIVFPLTVEPGCVFVLGDNRENSQDSRFSTIGQIDEREILGRVFFILIPGRDASGELDFSRIGVVR